MEGEKQTTAGLKNQSFENVKVKTASLLDTGYANETFDAVTAYAVMDHLVKKDAEQTEKATELLFWRNRKVTGLLP